MSRRKRVIEEYFDTSDWQDDWSPRYNIAPTQPVPVIRQHPQEPARRMPVILSPDSYNLWLDPRVTDVQVISEVLKPYDAQLMRRYPVSSRINHVSNDDPECSQPVEVAQNRLLV